MMRWTREAVEATLWGRLYQVAVRVSEGKVLGAVESGGTVAQFPVVR